MKKTPDNIVIATGIYPPEIGGPAGYARELFNTFLTQRYKVSVVTFGYLKKFPTGVRHLLYFFKLVYSAIYADYIIALDTFSVALPSMLFSKLTSKKLTLRVAGDFLWESYCERTKTSILLSEFYSKKRKYSLREKIVFLITKFILKYSDGLVFSTEWQKDITLSAYGIINKKTYIIKNFFPKVEIQPTNLSDKKVFLSPSRDIYIKNKKRLMEAFSRIKEQYPDVVLDMKQVSNEVLVEKLINSYAVLVPSISEVSSNLICDALRYDIPVLVTKDNGMIKELEGLVVTVDPLSVDDIASGIEKLLNIEVYNNLKQKIYSNTYSHSWNEIAQEFVDLYSKI